MGVNLTQATVMFRIIIIVMTILWLVYPHRYLRLFVPLRLVGRRIILGFRLLSLYALGGTIIGLFRYFSAGVFSHGEWTDTVVITLIVVCLIGAFDRFLKSLFERNSGVS